jgi:hypothetical protein
MEKVFPSLKCDGLVNRHTIREFLKYLPKKPDLEAIQIKSLTINKYFLK